jgi:hypothetical protein
MGGKGKFVRSYFGGVRYALFGFECGSDVHMGQNTARGNENHVKEWKENDVVYGGLQ